MDSLRDKIRAVYPEVLNLNQVRTILKISKRKASWMLQHGYIKCKISEKQTRQYEISIDALFDYIDRVSNNDPSLRIPVGIFSSKSTQRLSTKRKKQLSLDLSLSEDFKEWLGREWANVADMLTIKGVTRLTGYADSTVQKWTSTNKLKCVVLEDNTILITKEWLIEFYYSEGQLIRNKCDKHIKLMNRYYVE